MTAPSLDDYGAIVGKERIEALRRLARRLEGTRVVLVSSTRVGGGVAEMLARHVPLLAELGIRTRWEVMRGTPEFFGATKVVHNALQGSPRDLSPAEAHHYAEVNRENAGMLDLDADVVVVHDPQPAALIEHAPKRCPWIWRCHVDASRPNRSVWRFLRRFVARYDASVFSMPGFAQNLPHPQYVIAPAIDPLAPKNREMERSEVEAILTRLGLDSGSPLVAQVSRFDKFKDPIGVVRAFRMARRYLDFRLVLAGGGADDDPEGAEVLRDVRAAAAGEDGVRILELPAGSDLEVNALQRAARVIVQKSTREGFGLTVTEGLWKGRPVIGGATGGIQVQVYDHMTGFLVHSPEGLAYRLRYLLNRPAIAEEMGARGRELVRYHFLLTRQIRDWLTLLLECLRRL